MPLSVNVSTGLVKGRFGSGVVAGPNGEKLLVPARGRIDFEPVAPYVPYPTGTPSAFTILRRVTTGILDSEGYLCAPHPDYPEVPGVRGLELYSPDDPQAGVQGWTWKGTPRFVNADGTRLHNAMEPFTFDLPYGEEVDLVNVVDMPQSPGIGKEQAIILAASAQAHAASADAAAEAAAADAKVAREGVAEVVGALPSKADLIDGKVPVDQLPPAVGVTDEVVAPLVDMPETAAKIDARVAEQVAGKLDADTAADIFQTKSDAAGLPARLGDTTTPEGKAVAASVTPPALSMLRAALISRNKRPVVIVGAGSSTTAGSKATKAENRWFNRFAAAVMSAYPLSSGAAHADVKMLSAGLAAPTTPGLHFVNAGIGGTTAENYLTPTTGAQVAALAPDVIFHMVGSNDRNDGVPMATYIANLRARLNQLDADAANTPLHILIHQYRRRTWVGAAEWQVWGAALRGLANERPGNAVFLDLTRSFEVVGVPGADPYGLLDPDLVHLNDEGHEFLADLMVSLLNIVGSSVRMSAAPTPPVDPPKVETATLFTSDTFNRPDTEVNAIGVTDGALGGASGVAWSPSSSAVIIGNQVGATSALNTTRTVSVDVGTPDHQAEIVWRSGECGVAVRVQSNASAPDKYFLRFTSSGNLQLAKVVGGASTSLTSTVPYGLKSGDTLALRVHGSTLTGYVNGVEVIRGTDTAFPAGSRCGFQTSFSDPTFRLDDFKAYKITMETPA